MDVGDTLEIVEGSSEYAAWKKSHKASYLVHFFAMADDGPLTWEIGYYNKDDTISSFVVQGKKVELSDSAQIFKKSSDPIPRLQVENIHTHFAEILDDAFAFSQKEYPNEKEIKRIVLLQHTDLGQVWNITFITQSYKTLNMKFDAATGKLIKHSLGALIDQAKTEEVSQQARGKL